MGQRTQHTFKNKKVFIGDKYVAHEAREAEKQQKAKEKIK